MLLKYLYNIQNITYSYIFPKNIIHPDHSGLTAVILLFIIYIIAINLFLNKEPFLILITKTINSKPKTYNPFNRCNDFFIRKFIGLLTIVSLRKARA